MQRPDPADDHARVRAAMLAGAPSCRTPWFTRVGVRDLAFLFEQYDHLVFEGSLRRALAGAPLTFRLSKRMTRTAGTTVMWAGPRFEITLSSHLLFDNFNPEDRGVTVCGLQCPDRLAALQRVFEHELIHLSELLAFGDSDCRADRFAGLAAGLFGHREGTHALITRAERAVRAGLTPGATVAFWHQGRRYEGVVNRVTKRATVLVPAPDGQRYSDGRTYEKYYIPLASLTLIAPA